MNITRIFVVGAGTMGNGIAQTAAVSGYQVTMTDVIPEALQRGQAAIARSVEKLASKGSLTEEQKQAALTITPSADLEPAPQADLVVEAATEDPAVKLRLFGDLDRVAPAGAILASNTSSISITRIPRATRRPAEGHG